MAYGREITWTLRRLIRLAPLAALVVMVNVIEDPARVASRGAHERVLADILLSGRHAAGASNYDDRLLQRLYAEGLEAAPDVLVVGSSRVMTLRGKDFAPRSFYNASVSSATLHDVLALYELFTARRGGPSLLVIGVDPWMLQPNESMVNWQTLAPEFDRVCRKTALPECDQAAPFVGARRFLAAAMSPSYFQVSSLALWRRLSRGDAGAIESLRPVIDDADAPDYVVRRADGSIRYPREMGQDIEQVRSAARDYGRDFQRGRIKFLPPAARPAPRFVGMLEATIQLSRRAGAVVWLVLAPYHPAAWPGLSAEGSMIVQSEDVVRRLGAEQNVLVLGSFDPSRAGCPDAGEYDDPAHPRESCLARLIASIPASEFAR